jgi:hypothetical protein
MSLKVLIEDGNGTGKKASITKENAMLVSDLRLPPENINIPIRPFRQFMLNGTSSDMRVSGTAADPIDFVISATEDSDRYLDSISWVIADAQAALNKFGNITALTNGVEIFYQDAKLGDVVIADSLKSNFEFIRLCGKGASPIGGTTDAYRASNVEGASEGYIMTLDFSDQFGMPWGIRLPKDSNLKLIARIKDDTTGVDAFNAIAYGFDRVF